MALTVAKAGTYTKYVLCPLYSTLLPLYMEKLQKKVKINTSTCTSSELTEKYSLFSFNTILH